MKLEPVQVLLIAGGGYFLYRALTAPHALPAQMQTQNSVTNTGTQNSATSTATQQQSQAVSTAPSSSSQTQDWSTWAGSNVAPNQTPPGDSVLMAAALRESDASKAGSYRQNWWAWNYYRSRAAEVLLGIENPDPEIYAPDLGYRFGITPEQMITAGEYHNLLKQAGVAMTGLFWR